MGIFDIFTKNNNIEPQSEFKPVVQSWLNETLGFSNFFGQNKNYQVANKTLVKDGYLLNDSVYGIVTRIANTIQEIEVEAYKYSQKKKVEIESGDIYEMLRNPNSKQSWQDFINEAVTQISLTGNLFIKKTLIGNRVSSLSVIKSNTVDIMLTSSNEIAEFHVNSYGKVKRYQLNEIIFIKYENPLDDCSHWGLSPLQAGYLPIKTSNEASIANSVLLENRGVNAIISSPQSENANSLTPDEAKDIAKATKKKFGGADKANSVTVTTGAIQVSQLGMSSTDLQIIQSQNLTLRQICRVFNAPSQLFGDDASSTYNNVKEAEKAFYINCCIPILSKIIRGIEADFKFNYKTEWINIELELCTDDIEVLQDYKLTEQEAKTKEADSLTKLLGLYNQNQLSKTQIGNILTAIMGYDIEQVNILLKEQPKQVINQNNNTNGTN